MTVKFHVSKKGPAGELFGVQAEHDDPGQAYQNFRVAAEDAGLNGLVEFFGQAGVTGAAIAAATAITQPAADPWATPVQQYAPVQAQPQVPAAAGRACHHGPLTRRTGTNQRGDWVGWFCPSPKGTPDQCKPSFD